MTNAQIINLTHVEGKSIFDIKINEDISFGGDVVPIISGPNGIENKELIFRCCELLEKNNLKLFRFVKLPLQSLISFPFFDFSKGDGKCTNPFGFVNITLDFFHTYFSGTPWIG